MSLSIDTIMDCMNKPYKLQVIQLVQDRTKCTAQELQEMIPEIPQATMYRILNDLVKKEILVVCEEINVRAVRKKVYAISPEWVRFQNSMVTENDGEAYFRAFSAFMLKLAGEFKEYAKRDDINLAQDGSGFGAVTIYADQQELLEIGTKINEVIREYQMRKQMPERKQKQYTFATILTPPQESGEVKQ